MAGAHLRRFALFANRLRWDRTNLNRNARIHAVKDEGGHSALSNQLYAPQIVQMQHALDLLLRIHDTSDVILRSSRIASAVAASSWRRWCGMGVHGFAGGTAEAAPASALQQSAQIAVADDAPELALLLHVVMPSFFEDIS